MNDLRGYVNDVIQWNLCNMDTLGPTKSVLISRYLVLVKCVDYAGILIFKCPKQGQRNRGAGGL